MKRVSLIVLTLFIATIVSAKCANRGIYCLSQSSTLNKNGLVILEFYAASQEMISDLNTKHQVYLMFQKERVPLRVIEILKGEMRVTQVVLKPDSDLTEGKVYTLQIDNLPEYERKPERFNNSTNKWEQLTFKVINLIDNDIPVLNNIPVEQKKTLVYYGCGPAKWVYFTMAGQDKSELFVRASVKNKASGQTTTYILNIENGMVKVGHGMCSGAFYFDNSDTFEVTFQLFDQSGNKGSLTKGITFTKPITSTVDE